MEIWGEMWEIEIWEVHLNLCIIYYVVYYYIPL